MSSTLVDSQNKGILFYGISGFLRTPNSEFICNIFGNIRSCVQLPIMLNRITYTIRKPTLSCYDNLFLVRWCFYKSELRSQLSCFLFNFRLHFIINELCLHRQSFLFIVTQLRNSKKTLSM